MKTGDLIKTPKHFLLLGVLPSVFFLTFVILTLSWMQNIHLSNTMQALLNHSYHMFYGELYDEARVINVLADQMAERKEVQEAFLEKSREGLLEAARPFFLDIRGKHQITHLYFHSLDRTNFLRVHYPELFGDAINRFTLSEAEKSGLVSYGLELGTMGTLTLRVVIPWRINGKLVGYIEMGKEIDGVIDEMKESLEVDLVIVVNKSQLNKQGWKEGWKEGYGKRNPLSDWDHFPDAVVFASTLEELPPLIDMDLSQSHHMHKDLFMEININSRQYIAGFAPLIDASEKDIGDIIIIKDFEGTKNVAKNITLFVLVGYLLCVLLYIAIIFIYLRHMKIKLNRIEESDLSDD